ncbi:tRNA splicing endonuclease subunit SEN54 SKDI_16G1920 [Saccharomyces kudriavzevii IFO 1802]|uniref:tRNA-splicing endonuclease subunit Sen54 N-terminal domain-containing protein n=1 Tax=Saccharomyces kudriavzevii (strain ATCC MYA-4449 / AS 2.2408 / CBS 8840 / NBRC 1802 / NCYC 2889) TaxID=226230 RepID=A0AA35J9G3_SACK1|nr:uncharacterized protein SKDI_16G1920 [Saccharomyces kudriavzevii IFO 1802]CAI4053338.1 hypothetical protein SKDI_16G1920 [Saccharomyces kudriavzevii IFO 1802]
MQSIGKENGQKNIPDREVVVVEEEEEEQEELNQDWSQVASLVNKNAALSLPKKGEKDYEPDGTDLQELLLYKAKKAMFDTISDSIRGTTIKSQVKGYYVPHRHQAILPKPKGSFMQTMGRADRYGEYWLEFHEFVYLAERGTIIPYYKLEVNSSGESLDHDIEILLSMEDLYSLFSTQQEMDQYFVFAHLKRLGFILKLCGQDTGVKTSFYPARKQQNSLQMLTSRLLSLFKIQEISLFSGFFYCKWNFFFRKYTTSPQIYQNLNRLICSVAVPKTKYELWNAKNGGEVNHKKQHLPLTFDVWKPHANFKKKNPGLPDFQILVFNKNDDLQHFPTYEELRSIFTSLDYKFEFLNRVDDDFDWDANSYVEGIARSEYNLKTSTRSHTEKKASALKTKSNTQKKTKQPCTKKRPRTYPPHIQQNRRLKAGYRSFILAIMDNGLISFVKMSEADFGSENVWYTPNSQNKPVRKLKGGKA